MKRQVVYRTDGRVEVVCEHGVGHPTPASAAKVAEKYGHKHVTWMVHGCDGCCSVEGFFTEDEQL